ncbi:MAG: hypothetical protein IPK63_04555 [Candidatus Competibacteraceae bacterium]|nr:hypothetical protein [Candidatus Competibacteraceae bacterium]
MMPPTSGVLAKRHYPGGQTLLRVRTPLAAACQPGHALRIDEAFWAVLQPAPAQGWVDCLKHSKTPPALATEVTIQGPFGEPFALAAVTPRALLLADSEGIAQIVFLGRTLRHRQPPIKLLALFELTPPLPFRPQPSKILIPGLPAGVIAALPLLEDSNIPSRIACPIGNQPGSFEGTATELARDWLEIGHAAADLTLFACGGKALLDAASGLASRYKVVCQTRLSP